MNTPVARPGSSTAAPAVAGGTLPATGAKPLAVLGVAMLDAAWLTRRRTA